MFSFVVFALLGLALRAAADTASTPSNVEVVDRANQEQAVDDVLAALNRQLASSNAKVEALRSSTARVLQKRHADTKRHASILGRKRQAAEPTVCPDGSTRDTDRDGHLDCFDQCPSDFRKTRPGDCGCGVADVDSDADGVADCLDECPLDASKTNAGLCGCGAADTGCGCNVAPAQQGDCSRVFGVQRASATRDVSFDVFGPHGGLGARLVLPAGALAMADDEQLMLTLAEPRANLHSDSQQHGSALNIDIVGGAVKRERATNGYLLERAARVCLGVESELQTRGLCMGFFDAKSDTFKCFETALEYEPKTRLACARVALLAPVQLVRATRHTALAPYIKSVEPNEFPADGSRAMRVEGGNFDRGVLTRVAVGGAELDVERCRYNAHTLECDGVPAGRGLALALELEFTNHAAADMTFAARFDDAVSYEPATIHEVTLHGDRVHVRGANFGPEGELHASAVTVDGEPCADARVAEHDTLLTCRAPSRALAKRKVFDVSPDDDDDDHSHDYYAADGSILRADDDDDDSDAPIHVAINLHPGAGLVRSHAAHWTPACGAGEAQCGDHSCVARTKFCAHCSSGWAQCPLSAPVQANGRCHSWRWQVEHRAANFDVTLGGHYVRVPIGEHGAVAVTPDAAPVNAKHCLSLSMPAHEDGFASRVFNISSQATWRDTVRLEVRSDAVREAGGDPYGFCLARYHPREQRWECVDESLEVGPAPDHYVAGDVMLHAGQNWFALVHDNCPHVANPTQEDEDGNGVGDACDAPAEIASSCRDLSMGNVKYIRKQLAKTFFDVEEQPCPYDKQMPVCNIDGKIFQKHAEQWSGPRRPLPLESPYPASDKGPRKGFPARDGINKYPVSDRITANLQTAP